MLLWRHRRRQRERGPLARRSVGVGYFDNFKGWLQEGSTLTLLGGLRGAGARGSRCGWRCSAARWRRPRGKHIHIDVVFRFLPRTLRAAGRRPQLPRRGAVCFAAVWGFFDHIAIESYGANADDRAGAKIANAVHHIGNHAFLTRKQLGLDLRSLPRVLGGERYDQWMSAGDVERVGRRAPVSRSATGTPGHEVDPGPDGRRHAPPGGPSPDGDRDARLLAHTLGLVFPFGLLAIGAPLPAPRAC